MRFSLLSEYFERIEQATERLEMTDILAELIDKSSPDEIREVIYLCQGQLAPAFKGIEMGMSEKFILRTLSDVANLPTAKVQEVFRAEGDIGLAAQKLVRGGKGVSVSTAFKEMLNIARTSGARSQEQKINLLGSLLRGVSPGDARYIARFVMGRLRLGIGDPTVLDSLAQIEVSKSLDVPLQGIPQQSLKKQEKIRKFNTLIKSGQLLKEVDRELKETDQKKTAKEDALLNKRATLYFQKLLERRRSARELFERAYNLCSDLGLIAETYKKQGMKGITKIHITIGYPVRMALCERLPSSKEIIEKLGVAAVEAKYDGLRLQVHIDGKDVQIFSRNLERMTDMFPDITEAARALPCKNAVIEGEALVYNEVTGELQPFQVTMQRRRKHLVKDKAEELPLKLFVFELLYLDGKDYTGRPYVERRRAFIGLLRRSTARQSAIVPAEMFETSDPEEIERHFGEFIETGLEGVVAKRLDSPYAAGARNYNWIKLKRSYRGELADTVDVCIVGYFLGKGQRAKFKLGAVLGAVYDEQSDTFKTISKIGTGFTEKNLKELENILKDIRLQHKHPRTDSLIVPDVWVEPRFVITVTADEITRSPSHTAGIDKSGKGYALRFPRAIQTDGSILRADKNAEDASTVDEIIKMERQQKTLKIV